MAHRIVHIELSANDHREAATWYKEVFGWETREFPEMNYTTFSPGEDSVGGGFNPVQEGMPAGRVLVYIETDDVDAHLEKIRAHGGNVVAPAMDVPTVGRLGFFQDPTGNMLALLQPEMEQAG